MKKIFLTLLIAIVLVTGGFILYIYSGAYDISQLTPHNGLTKWVIHTTTHNSIDKRIKDIKVPATIDSTMQVIGFRDYNNMCSSCHGAPGINAEEMALGLYPKPPVFYKSDDMPDAAEAFWITKNGIKMTSMPAFGPTHSDAIIWAITDFLVNKMNTLSPQEYKNRLEKYREADED